MAASWYPQQAETASLVGQVLDVHVTSLTHYYIPSVHKTVASKPFCDKFWFSWIQLTYQIQIFIDKKELPLDFKTKLPWKS